MNEMPDEYPSEDGRLGIICYDVEKALMEGKACQFYEMDYPTAIERLSKMYPEADLWYTERNGDPITMLVPKGTKAEQLPKRAMSYLAFEWIKHDKEFGTGVCPFKYDFPLSGALKSELT